ncbi:hypothetical protein [Halobacillus sp. Marseille-Q1614]|uniref:hypothetical protein n=1 Tax=Halobacillus sp. Marseille-Q1614 TaxID=2709134 RepID=UPI0020C20484|nr:hypothetical protein [Halobacillus sp. Marseille-Q1614]
MIDARNNYNYQNAQVKPTHEDVNKHKFYHVMVSMEDGSSFDGIITDVNDDDVTVLMGEEVMVDENGNETNGESRQFYPYGYGGWRARRFRRAVFPLAALTALALYPYAAPFYPYYPYYPYY